MSVDPRGRSHRGHILSLVAPVFVFSLVINLLLFTSPLYMMQVYDRVLASRSESTLVALTVIAAFLLALVGAFELVRSRILVRMGVRYSDRVSPRLFDAVSERELAVPRSGAGQHLRDADAIRDFLSGTGLIAFCDAPWAPVFVVVCWLLHPWLGATALVGALALFGIALASEALTRKPLQEAGKAMGRSMNEAAATLHGAEAIRGLGMQEAVRRRWLEMKDEAVGWQALASDRAGGLLSISKAARHFLQSAVLGVGALLAIRQEISPGVMIAASILMGRALAPVELAVGNWKGFNAARAAHERITRLLEGQGAPSARPAIPAPAGHLTVDGVVVAAPGGFKPTLVGVTFEVKTGESVAIVGPSASGKSSLIRALVGIWPVHSGSLRMDGYTLDQWEPDVLGRHLGYVPQEVDLFAGTVAENIARLGDVDMDAVIEAATLAGLHETIQRLPGGYGTRVGPGGLSLSGGQRQRVALARALYGRPPLLVLDEPNSNLDAAGEEALMKAIRQAKASGQAVVFTTHKPSVLQVADRILVLADGTVRAYGPKESVLPTLMGRRPTPRFENPIAEKKAS